MLIVMQVFLLKEQLQERKSAEAAIKAEADARISDLKKHAESQLAELQGALLCSSHEKEALLRQLHDCSAEAQVLSNTLVVWLATSKAQSEASGSTCVRHLRIPLTGGTCEMERGTG